MFNLFKKKSELEVLTINYKKLLAESHRLSHINRKESDEKLAQAEEVMKQIEVLKNK